ncbi:DUF2382 domain-containing protein [Leptolyngbya sp. FACHB-261]|uniref:DUF2382 domain-containing protein n=1 Tax=Leptolyngbya sp. FACHB-261 TaxID=2692806 RepID=UPI0028C46F4E|nr:DUF2382 domain-containing protein [Leptolyngbya sp. FACHB-261]
MVLSSICTCSNPTQCIDKVAAINSAINSTPLVGMEGIAEESIRLLDERLVVNRSKRKTGEIIVRKEIETRIVEVPVRYEKLIVEQINPESNSAPQPLGEVALGRSELHSNSLQPESFQPESFQVGIAQAASPQVGTAQVGNAHATPFVTRTETSAPLPMNEEVTRLLGERLVVERGRQKVGEIVVRKQTETRLVRVPVRYEKLIVEQLSPERKILAEVELGQGEVLDEDLPNF